MKEEYEPLRKKYNLPQFEELDNELDTASIEKPVRLLRQLRHLATERIKLFSDVLNVVLHPDTGVFCDWYECSSFSDEERAQILGFYKRLMIVQRSLLEAEIACDERLDADTLKLAFETLHSMKQDMRGVVTKMKGIWTRPAEPKELLGYLG